MKSNMNPLRPTHRHLLLLCLALLLPPSLRALEFRVLGWNGPIDGIFLLEDTERIPLRSDGQNFSARHQTAGPGNLILYRETLRDEERIPVPVATLPIPRDYPRAILVIAQSPADPNQVAGMWIDDSAKTFPVGTFVFHNLSEQTVALNVADKIHMLNSRESWSTRFPANSRRSGASAAIRDGDSIRFILGQDLKTHPEYRILFFFRKGRPHLEGSDEIDIPVEFVMIYDHHPPEPEPGETP